MSGGDKIPQMRIALLKVRSGKYSEGIKILQDILKQDPNSVEVINLLSDIYLREEINLTETKTLNERSLTLKEDQVESLMIKA